MTTTLLTRQHFLRAAAPLATMRPSTGARAASAGLVLLLAVVSMSPAAAQQPANDAFAESSPLAGENGVVGATNVAATAEPGEPRHAEADTHASLWWRWTAPFSGAVAFDTIDSDFDTLLGVYTGDSLDTLRHVAQNDDAGYSFQSLTTFSAVAGSEYRIAVDCYRGERGPFSLRWTRLEDNNDFADAITLTGPVGTTVGDSYRAGFRADREIGEPLHAGSDEGASVWWKWTAVEDGPITFDTFGSRFTTVLAIYTGTGVRALNLVASEADYEIAGRCRITVQATAGTTYHLAVDGVVWEEGMSASSGEVVLRWGPPLPNDTFSDALTLTGLNGTTTGTNNGATLEPGEPDALDGSPGGASVWWVWTPGEDGVVTFDTLGTRFDTLLGAYVGEDVAQLVLVADNDESAERFTSEISFAATAGTSYRIAVHGYEGEFGTITLNWTWTPVPQEDPPQLAAPVPLPGGSFRLLLLGAPGQTGQLQWSDESMQTWTDWRPFALDGTPLEFIDDPPAASRARFYRVKPR